MDERTYVYSNWLDFPVVLKEPFEQRVYIAWRGLPLQSPPRLERIKSERYVAVLKAWRENSCALIKLRHPDLDHVWVDYMVNWIMKRQDGRTIVLLQLPPGFPGQELAKMILTYFVGEKIFTMKDEEFNEMLENLQKDMSNRRGKPEIEPEQLFGRMPNANSLEAQISQAARLRLMAKEEGRKQCCLKCEKEIDKNNNFCATCGAKRSAPECPKCRHPVTAAMDARVRYHDENGYYPWHFGWDGKCIMCDFDFATRLVIETGHNLFFSSHAHEIMEEAKANPDKFKSSTEAFAGKTTIDIAMDQSIFMAYDAWDYQPTIAVSLKRWQPANHDGDGALKEHETFVLTPAEWRAIAEQLDGPLKVLLERQPWTRDTT